MRGFQFTKPFAQHRQTPFERLLDVFLRVLPYVNGDVAEALDWLAQIDEQHNLTTSEYDMGDFIEDLEKEGYISDDNEEHQVVLTAKSEQQIRNKALEQLFGKLKRKGAGHHRTPYDGTGGENLPDLRDYRFGDKMEDIDFQASIRGAMNRVGLQGFRMQHDDLRVRKSEHKARMATVLMIDISHSMILYGEDRITPAKQVAMALAELINRKYPTDSLDIVAFGNDAFRIAVKDLPYLSVGPYHTNTVAGLEMAMDILRRKKDSNKQIVMVTDGKPTCIKENGRYYKNSFGLDRKVVNKTLQLAKECRRLRIPITTFMIASDPALEAFVREFTEVNNGRAYYSNLDGLGEMLFEDFENHRKKRF